jgi:hypothetical protein
MVPLVRPWASRKASSACTSTSTMALPMPTTSKLLGADSELVIVAGAIEGE